MNVLNPLPPFVGHLMNTYPTVFVEGMSYDEVLYKIQGAVNKVIESQNSTIENVNELENDFKKLNKFIEDYFNNLDVQEEINNKLDEMYNDGRLKEIMDALFYEFENKYNFELQETNTKIDKVSSRVDNIITNGTPTEGNTELIDIRNAFDGTTYKTAGEAVRASDKLATNKYTKSIFGSTLKDANLAPYGWLWVSAQTSDQIANLPVYSFRGVLITYREEESGSNFEQIAISENSIYVREMTANSNFKPWFKLQNNVDMLSYVVRNKYSIRGSTLKDANNSNYGWQWVSETADSENAATTKNLPEYPFTGSILTLSETNISPYENVFTQLAITSRTRSIFYRTYNGVEYSSWCEYNPDDITKQFDETVSRQPDNLRGATFNDANNAPYGWVWVYATSTEQISNLPFYPFRGALLTLNDTIDSTSAAQQVAFTRFGLYYREQSYDVFSSWKKSVNNFYPSKISSIGDSITYGFIPRNSEGYPGKLKSYCELLAEYLGCSIDNQGISGSTVATPGNNPMCLRYDKMADDADIITFMGGTNDIRYEIPVGTFDDTETSTFYGALKSLFGGIYKKYFIDQDGTNKKVIIFTPIKLLKSSANEAGGTGILYDLSEYCEAIKTVAGYYSFTVIDLQNISEINPHINQTIKGTENGYTGYYNKYITDGTHPTQEGHHIIAKVIYELIK